MLDYFFSGNTYYPLDSGLLFKFGAGYNRFTESMLGGIHGSDSHVWGYGGLIGTGYDFNLVSSFNLGLHVDYIFQNYDKGGINNISFFNFYISFYWF